jgi:membrane protease subunit (stomatin/prohibitin family)
MNNIYKCGVLYSQLSTLKLLKEDIIKLSKNEKLSKEMESELENKINKINLSINSFKCKSINDKND